MAGFGKFIVPIDTDTYDGLLSFSLKMRRVYRNKYRIQQRQILKKDVIIQELKTLQNYFCIQVTCEQKLCDFILAEIKVRGFDVNMIMREANTKYLEWGQSDDYRKIIRSIVRSK